MKTYRELRTLIQPADLVEFHNFNDPTSRIYVQVSKIIAFGDTMPGDDGAYGSVLSMSSGEKIYIAESAEKVLKVLNYHENTLGEIS